jgi:hypothetical protein
MRLNAVVRRRDPGRLQPDTGLFGPEPRDLIVGSVFPVMIDATCSAWSTAFCTDSSRTHPLANRHGNDAQSPMAEMAASAVSSRSSTRMPLATVRSAAAASVVFGDTPMQTTASVASFLWWVACRRPVSVA